MSECFGECFGVSGWVAGWLWVCGWVDERSVLTMYCGTEGLVPRFLLTWVIIPRVFFK